MLISTNRGKSLNHHEIQLHFMKIILSYSYDYSNDYEDEDDDDSGVSTSNDSTGNDSNVTLSNSARSAQGLRRINSASSILGFNILLTPELDSYYGDFKQSNSEGFRVNHFQS